MDRLAVDAFPVGGAFVVGEGVVQGFSEGGVGVGEGGGGGGVGEVGVVVESGVVGSRAAMVPAEGVEAEVVPLEVVLLPSACFLAGAGGRGLMAGPPGLETESCGFGGGIVGRRATERVGG